MQSATTSELKSVLDVLRKPINAAVDVADAADAKMRDARRDYFDTLADFFLTHRTLRRFAWKCSSRMDGARLIAQEPPEHSPDRMTIKEFVLAVMPKRVTSPSRMKCSPSMPQSFSLMLAGPLQRDHGRRDPDVCKTLPLLEVSTARDGQVAIEFRDLTALHEFALEQKLEVDYSGLLAEWAEQKAILDKLSEIVDKVNGTTPQG